MNEAVLSCMKPCKAVRWIYCVMGHKQYCQHHLYGGGGGGALLHVSHHHSPHNVDEFSDSDCPSLIRSVPHHNKSFRLHFLPAYNIQQQQQQRQQQ